MRAARAPRHASRPRAARAAAQQLSTAWTAALRKAVGDLPLDLRVSYDGDCLHDNVAQGAELDDLPNDAKAMIGTRATTLGVPTEVTQGRATAPVRKIADRVADRYGLNSDVVRWFVREFFSEVPTYLRPPGGRAVPGARRIKEHEPSVVIAHSPGSPVAYETLCHHDEIKVDLMITIGSPLRMPDVGYDRRPVTSPSTPSPGLGQGPQAKTSWAHNDERG
ncbi:hypothetical protein [Phytohabitans aurantiacus]|uniref:Uncharacterized protein n=1 Tax=Phytohabitans aurantiacus TaxID=3016789 RepID=A0ABQ5R3H3_9ACTN|nr:hypothetical protein [Phytohabitans aurantiacus]GLI01230.1 hypothetical protein Pa4123_65060 [Phytohabitans aurantiacus]